MFNTDKTGEPIREKSDIDKQIEEVDNAIWHLMRLKDILKRERDDKQIRPDWDKEGYLNKI